jgi:hypothetical protein
MQTIDIEMLKSIFASFINKLEREVGKQVKIEGDYYRIIPTEKWNDFEASEEGVGSLYDDIAELKKLADVPEHPCTFVDFDRMASVLRAISQTYNPI